MVFLFDIGFIHIDSPPTKLILNIIVLFGCVKEYLEEINGCGKFLTKSVQESHISRKIMEQAICIHEILILKKKTLE